VEGNAMGLYNFKQQFVTPIVTGRKKHTIRGVRRYPDKPGNTMHLYTGLRTKSAKLIKRVVCAKIERIDILLDQNTERWTIYLDGAPLDLSESESLARRDGFSSFNEMMTFWDGRLPFTGHIIHWR
jgi:hypothetical protein